MSDLSNEAKARLAALASEEPGAAEEARVRQGLERALGMTLPVATLGAASLASTATAATHAGASTASAAGTGASAAASTGAVVAGASSSAPWLIATLVAVVGGGVVVGLRSSDARPPSAAPPPTAPAQPNPHVPPPPAPSEAAPIGSVAPTTPEATTPIAAPPPARARLTREAARPAEGDQPAEETQAAAAEVTATPPPTPPLTVADEAQDIDPELVCDVDAEGRFATVAQAHLTADRAPRALELLEAFTRRCPSGRWSQHTWAVRLGALCALGRVRESEELRAWHREEYPAEAERLQRATATWCQPRPE